jgi:hypothetical protein
LKLNKGSSNSNSNSNNNESSSSSSTASHYQSVAKQHAIRRSVTSPGRVTIKGYGNSSKRAEEEEEEEVVILMDGMAVVPTTDSLESGEEVEQVFSGDGGEEESFHHPRWLSTAAPQRRGSLSAKASDAKATQQAYMRERRSRETAQRASENTGFVRGESANYRTVMSKRRGDVDISHVGKKSVILRSTRDRPSSARRSSWNDSVSLKTEHAAPVRGLSRRSKWMN